MNIDIKYMGINRVMNNKTPRTPFVGPNIRTIIKFRLIAKEKASDVWFYMSGAVTLKFG